MEATIHINSKKENVFICPQSLVELREIITHLITFSIITKNDVMSIIIPQSYSMSCNQISNSNGADWPISLSMESTKTKQFVQKCKLTNNAQFEHEDLDL